MRVMGIILLCLSMAGIILWLLWRLWHTREALRQQENENHRLRGLLQMGTQMAQTDLAQLRQLRHDLRQYLTATENASLPAETAALQQALADPAAAPARENWVISVLERHYTEQARAQGFQADLRITPPHRWEQAVPDVCLVLSNLLENSLEALQREGGGWLRARSISTPGYFSLVVGNSCSQPLRTVNGRYLSSKAPGRFGIGLATVRKVAQRYGGQAEFTAENGEFLASVFLPRPASDLPKVHPPSAPQTAEDPLCSQ